MVKVIFHLEDNLERTIYFSDAKGNIQLKWLEDKILSISNFDDYENRSIELMVEEEVYDEQGKAYNAYKVKKKYTCYSKDNMGM